MKHLGYRVVLIVSAILFFLLSAFSGPVQAACDSIPTGIGSVTGSNCTNAGRTDCRNVSASGLSYCCDSVNECPNDTLPPGTDTGANICNFAGDKRGECISTCMGDGKGVWSSIGCIPTEPSALIAKVITFGIGIAGGIAFLLILFGGFQILTSAGNPEQLNAGRELITSAISGLLLIVFSVFVLRIIGVDILGLPGFH